MIADFYTKPLQGSLFIKMRNFIMGLGDEFCEERVEMNGKLKVNISETQDSLPNGEIRRKPTYLEMAKKASKIIKK